jgi:hypothetical protein
MSLSVQRRSTLLPSQFILRFIRDEPKGGILQISNSNVIRTFRPKRSSVHSAADEGGLKQALRDP